MEKAILPQELGVLPLCKVMLEHTLTKLSKATQKRNVAVQEKLSFTSCQLATVKYMVRGRLTPAQLTQS